VLNAGCWKRLGKTTASPSSALRRLEEEVQSLTAQLAQLEREDFNA